MGVPQNEEKQYEDHHHDHTEIFPCCGKTPAHFMKMDGLRVTLNSI